MLQLQLTFTGAALRLSSALPARRTTAPNVPACKVNPYTSCSNPFKTMTLQRLPGNEGLECASNPNAQLGLHHACRLRPSQGISCRSKMKIEYMDRTQVRVCVCICVCVCMYMYICMYVCVCIHICIYTYICLFICSYIYLCICLHIHTCMHACIHTYLHAHRCRLKYCTCVVTHIETYIAIHTYIDTYIHTYM